MYLQANPSKARSEKEKTELGQGYQVGEQVLPALSTSKRKDNRDEEDQRLMAWVREISLQEVGVGDSTSYARDEARRDRGERPDSRDERATRQSRGEADRRVGGNGHRGNGDRSDPLAQARQIEHQSSLRSLISSPNRNLSEMEEEIIQQIVDEGLLDNLNNVNGLDINQVEELLSEYLAETYRRRHGQSPRFQETPSEDLREISLRPSNRNAERSHHRRRRHSPQARDQPGQSTHPPISRPRLFEPSPASQQHRRRTSSNHRRQTSLVPGSSHSQVTPSAGRQPIRSSTDISRTPRASSSYQHQTRPTSETSSVRASTEDRRQASRSATDLSQRPRTSGNHQREASPLIQPSSPRMYSEARRHGERSATDLSNRPQSPVRMSARPATSLEHNRRSTDPGSHHVNEQPSETPAQIPRRGEHSEAATTVNRTPSNADVIQTLSNIASTATITSQPDRLGHNGDHSRIAEPPYPLDSPIPTSGVPSSTPQTSSNEPMPNMEPSVQCSRCGTAHLEYYLHQNCLACLNGDYSICLRCYRRGLGCLHWYGFGTTAPQRYQRQMLVMGNQISHEAPHVLVGRRYLRPVREDSSHNGPTIADDPTKRMQSGMFCSTCFDFADSCFWVCDICNEGEWGFCNECVNHDKCCGHPLLPVARKTAKLKSRAISSTHYSEDFRSSRSPNPEIRQNPFPGEQYVPLTFTTSCDICKQCISSSVTRFHCLECNEGDYDICTECYQSLVSTARISIENGPTGWRRCLKGHRMIVVGFRDSPSGSRRVIVNHLVGGHALKDDLPSSPANPAASSSTLDGDWIWRDDPHGQVHAIPSKSPNPSSSSSSPPSSPPTAVSA